MNKTNLNGKLIITLSRALQSTHRASELLFYQNDITMSQFMVLEALYHKGALTVKEIIDAILSSSGNMTVVLRNLEKQGLIERQCNPVDKRSFLIHLTSKGQQHIALLYQQHMNYVALALESISETEKKQVISILRKLSQKEEII